MKKKGKMTGINCIHIGNIEKEGYDIVPRTLRNRD